MIENTPSPEHALRRFVEETSLAPRQSHKALTLWPLVRTGGGRAPEYRPLAEALAAGDVVIEELASGATVPHVQLTNHGRVAVLVLFGEELRGAKQNRIANASFLVPAQGTVVIDVACVEQGRWSPRGTGARFEDSAGLVSSAIRRKLERSVSESVKRKRGFFADQGEVWDEVAARVAYSRTESASGAYADYAATRRHELDEMSAAFRCVPGQVGFVAVLADEVVGLEAVGRSEVFTALFPGLVRSYLLDAIDHALVAEREGARPAAARFADPEGFLAALAAAPVRTGASLGLGADVRFETERLRGCALVDGDVVHLTAYPVSGASGGGRRWTAPEHEFVSPFEESDAEREAALERLQRRVRELTREGVGREEKKAG